MIVLAHAPRNGPVDLATFWLWALHARVSSLCLVSRSLLGWGGGSITFHCLCPWSTVLVVFCGVVVGGRGNNVLLSVSMKYSVLVVSCGVLGGQQRLFVSCTLAYVTSYHLTPSATYYIFKWLFQIPWFVACWFHSFLLLSKLKFILPLSAAGAMLSSDELRSCIFSLPRLYIWGGFGWGGLG